MTAEELTKYFGFTEKNSVAPRLSELFGDGVLQKNGTKKSPITKRHTTVWAIKEAAPDGANIEDGKC